PPWETMTSQGYRVASWTSFVAARACRPSSLTIVNRPLARFEPSFCTGSVTARSCHGRARVVRPREGDHAVATLLASDVTMYHRDLDARSSSAVALRFRGVERREQPIELERDVFGQDDASVHAPRAAKGDR